LPPRRRHARKVAIPKHRQDSLRRRLDHAASNTKPGKRFSRRCRGQSSYRLAVGASAGDRPRYKLILVAAEMSVNFAQFSQNSDISATV
jgi:hypothetical protein